MSTLPLIIYSNQLEILGDRLADALYSPEISPFVRRIVIVPSAAMRSWLWRRIADRAGITAGVEGRYLNHALGSLVIKVVDESRPSFPSLTALALTIEDKIKKGADYYVSTSYDDEAKELEKKYTVVEKNKTYILIDLNKKK